MRPFESVLRVLKLGRCTNTRQAPSSPRIVGWTGCSSPSVRMVVIGAIEMATANGESRNSGERHTSVTTFVNPAFSGEMAYDGVDLVDDATPIVPGGVVEFRVHGVNGGTPEQNLGDPHPIRVAGDATAGIYRRREELNSGPDRTVEAYNWSSMNSQKSIRAWWLLLFPFAASSLAGWLLPPDLGGKTRSFAQMLVRVIALVVTFTAVVGMGLTTVDIIGVQCGGSQACTSNFWLGWLDTIVGWAPLEGLATRRAVLFSLVPLAALLLVWWVGRRSNRYERYGTPLAPTGEAAGKKRIDAVRLNEVEFWQAPDSVFVQMWIHVSVAIAGLAGVMAVSFRQLAPTGTKLDALGYLMWVSFGWTVIVGAGTLVVGRMPQIPVRWLRGDYRWFEGTYVPTWLRPRPLWIPAGISMVLLAATLALGWVAEPSADANDAAITEAVISDAVIHDDVITTGVIEEGILGDIGTIVDSFTDTVIVGKIVGDPEIPDAVITEGVITGGTTTIVSTEDGVITSGNIEDGVITRGFIPPLEAFRNAMIVASVLGLAALALLGASTRALPVVLSIVLIGILWFVVIWRVGPPGQVDLPYKIGGTWELWLVIEYGMFAIALLLYWVLYRNSRGPVNPLWATVGAALISAAGLGAIARSDSRWGAFAGAFLLVFAYVLLIFWIQIKKGHNRPEHGSLRHGSALMVASLGLLSMLTAVSSTAIWVARTVGTAVVSPTTAANVPAAADIIRYPAEAGWVAFAAFTGIVVAVLLSVARFAMLFFARWSRKEKQLCTQYDGMDVPDFGYDITDTCGAVHADGRLGFSKRARNARLVANFTDDADWIITSAMGAALAILVSTIASRSLGRLPTGELSAVIGFATWVIGFVFIGAVWAVRTAKDNLPLRQSFGMLWDVMAFFPRRFHPLAPPCYAEQAVLDVRDRLIWLRRKHAKTIVIAHSEGTLITCAAMLTLLPDGENEAEGSDPAEDGQKDERKSDEGQEGEHPVPTNEELNDLAWVTYGCMLNRLFGRAWPDELGQEDLYRLKSYLETRKTENTVSAFPAAPVGRLPRWINFGRYTDYLGGRVFSPPQKRPTEKDAWPEADPERCDDLFFDDPVRRWRIKGQVGFARMWRHSFNYESDEEDQRFRQYVWNMAQVFGGTLDETTVSASADSKHRCKAHVGNEE
jgi:hypothetical protein